MCEHCRNIQTWRKFDAPKAVSYTYLRAHETPEQIVCRLLLEKKKVPSAHYLTPKLSKPINWT